MNTVKYLVLLLAICMLFTGCRPKGGDAATDQSSSASDNPQVSELLEFHYGRLNLNDRFMKLNDHGVDFTLNFDKKIFTPEDDIVLTLYVTNYTEDMLRFSLQEPIVSRQQLIHASLLYGANGEYSVPVTIDYAPESDLEGGVLEVEFGNRKLIATRITFHTSAYTNIEESVFSREFAGTYRMSFWLGEDEYAYRMEPDLTFAEIEWNDPTQLQSLSFPEIYEETVGNVLFTVSFERALCGTDNDINIHVKIENLGREPLELYSDSDISNPIYYIRAELTYGTMTPVRDNVAGASEIVRIESRHPLKFQETLERDITFYASEFTNIKRSVYSIDCRDQCRLKVWVMLSDQMCEMDIPVAYSEYVPYSYRDREVPEITLPEPEVTSAIPET